MSATGHQISKRETTSDIWRKLCKSIYLGDFSYPNICEKGSGIGACNTDDSELTRQVKFPGPIYYPTGPQSASVPSKGNGVGISLPSPSLSPGLWIYGLEVFTALSLSLGFSWSLWLVLDLVNPLTETVKELIVITTLAHSVRWESRLWLTG